MNGILKVLCHCYVFPGMCLVDKSSMGIFIKRVIILFALTEGY